MDRFNTFEKVDWHCCCFFGTAAEAFVTAQVWLDRRGHAQAKPKELPTIKPGTNTSFGPLKQIDAGVWYRLWYKSARPTGRLSFSFMAGPMTSTALRTSRQPWLRPVIG